MTSTDLGVAAGRPAGTADDSRREALTAAWRPPPGVLGRLAAVNHKVVGKRFMVTAFAFLLVGGVEALMIRTQLARPESDVLGPEAFNQAFTMHGTTMLFFFAVPMLEGLAMYFAPLMVGTRDMPFPRLNQLGYWMYLFGGLFVYTSVLVGEVPDGGWFAYVPLTGADYSPGQGLDFWLLGVTFVEVSGVLGAIELITLFLKHRAPGMSLRRVPLFVWSVVSMAGAMLLAFPPLIAASMLLELERTFDLPFFDPARGGDPILWQHLFWIFGHPEVYIMLLPSVGIVSTVVSAAARRPIVGYPFVVLSLVAIAFVSFGLWVHHMFATGIPLLASAFFTAASLLIAVPSGVQVFAWIATLWTGRVRWTSPLLFVIGFAVIFVLGGITGVMVAVVPFDLQVHDSYFVVAHFHYVLVGGVVFPIFAGLHHWWPKLTGRALDESLARWTFWLMFIGFNIGFMPQHILGLLGMPRRVYTYREVDEWGGYNLLSTVGGFVLGLGILVFVLNVARTRRRPADAGLDPWSAGTLEWATASPAPAYNFERLPMVGDLHPGWEPLPGDAVTDHDRRLQEALRGPERGRREAWGTSPVDADVEELALVAEPSMAPLGVALGLVAALAGLLVDLVALEVVGGLVAAGALLWWLWPSDAERHAEPVDHERPLEPPAPARRPGVTVAGQWGVRLLAVAVTAGAAALAFSAAYLAANADDGWPPGGAAAPGLLVPALAVAALGSAALVATVTRRRLAAGRPTVAAGAVQAALALAAAALAATAVARWPVAPTDHAYGAVAVPMLGLPAVTAGVAAAMAAFVTVRAARSGPDERPAVAATIASSWTWFAAATALLLTATAVGVPHLS